MYEEINDVWYSNANAVVATAKGNRFSEILSRAIKTGTKAIRGIVTRSKTVS